MTSARGNDAHGGVNKGDKEGSRETPKEVPKEVLGEAPKEGVFHQFVKYGGVSFAQTFVELGVFALMNLTLPFSTANFVAVFCSATFQYVMNRSLTFRSSSSYVRSISLFVLLWIWNLAFSSFAIAELSAVGWSPTLVKVITMALQGCWGFLLSKYVIFR